MTADDLVAANRALLGAIEAAPPADVEDRLDDLAAVTWIYADETAPDPAPGRVRHLECKLAGIARRAEGEKRWRIERARGLLRRYARGIEDV